MFLKLAWFCCLVAVTLAQDYQEYQPHRPAPSRLDVSSAEAKPTSIPILKQINRHNEDGSYTYGYEGADGSFKIETKLATGEVKGKYGYVDANGKPRVVEYGANKYGFQPSGEGITVAPPTLVDETTNKDGLQINDYEDEPQPQPKQQHYQPAPPQHKFISRAPPPRPQPKYTQYEQEEEPQQPQYIAPSRAQLLHAQPINDVYAARQRASIRPEADYQQSQTFFPSPQVHEQPEYASPNARSYAVPRPANVPQQQPQNQIAYSAPRAAPAQLHHQLQHQQPQQQHQTQPQHHQPQPQQQQFQPQHHQPQPQHHQSAQQGGRSSSVLDQLAKDFALPQGGSPALHDISYSYY